ncbi:MAG TPA: hypothetical protein V6D47_09870 [Oscillatoriaceae cyanobacterium]
MNQQIDELKALYGEVASAVDGGNTFYLLKDVQLPTNCVPARCDLLLCAGPRDGYTSRLFFTSQVKSRQSRNWNGGVHLFDRTWHAISWKMPPEKLTLAQMVSTHLQALK